mmetsp:Transcript_1457/g.2666  ORF Transcript_1457/g.2666 Transcript_1457/m.2666 type:complete len:337 (-) Transcript_1457:82-1092(-)
MKSNKNNDARRKKNESFPWLKSPPGNEFFLLRLPGVTEEMLHNAVSFISNKCFYYNEADDGKKKFLHLAPIAVKNNKRESISLEKLFKEAVHGEKVEHDDFRFQTHPESETKLMKSKDVKDIYSMVAKTVQGIDNRFSVGKFSVLYSKPGGTPQGLHIDDFSKTKEEEEQFGEMLSAIVAIQDNTTIDVFANDNKSRVTIMIPRGFMFLFGGNFWHGGSAYECHNARLHFYFYRTDAMANKKTRMELERNEIVMMNVCPVPDCKEAINRTLFTSTKLQDHWYTTHRDKINLTYCQYISSKIGTLKTCEQCGKKLVSERAAKDHARICSNSKRKFSL